MASLTYKLGLNKKAIDVRWPASSPRIPGRPCMLLCSPCARRPLLSSRAQFSVQGVDLDGDGKADQVDEDGDGVLDDLYVCAAPGIDPFVAKNAKTPKSTSMDNHRYVIEDEPTKDSRLHNKFMPGYAGYIPTEMKIKTESGQWCPPLFLEVEAKAVRTAICRRACPLRASAHPRIRV